MFTQLFMIEQGKELQENLICCRENGDVERKGDREARDKYCSTKNKAQSTQAGKWADKHSGDESASGIWLDISASCSKVSYKYVNFAIPGLAQPFSFASILVKIEFWLQKHKQIWTFFENFEL